MYGTTCEELYDKEQEARRQVAEIIFHREHPTVAEYCEKWLLMQSAKVSPATLKGYASNMKNYISCRALCSFTGCFLHFGNCNFRSRKSRHFINSK